MWILKGCEKHRADLQEKKNYQEKSYDGKNYKIIQNRVSVDTPLGTLDFRKAVSLGLCQTMSERELEEIKIVV